jgi:hypothetical protein
MIGQYLPNNNEKSYNVVLQKNLDLNRPLDPNFLEKVYVTLFVVI